MTMRPIYCTRCGGAKTYGSISRGVRCWGLRCENCDLSPEEQAEEQRRRDELFGLATKPPKDQG
jgi:hypothetical protein